MKLKNKSQSLLETTMVFFSLVVLVLGSIRVFSGMGLIMANRIESYRQNRLSAFNSPSWAKPEDYLYKTNQLEIIRDNNKSSIFSLIFFEEPRLLQAQLLLEKQSNIMELVFPYKLNQARSILYGLSLTEGTIPDRFILFERCKTDRRGICLDRRGIGLDRRGIGLIDTDKDGNPDIDEIRDTIRYSLISRCIGLINEALNTDWQKVITLYKEVLDSPLKNGPYDPNPEKLPNETEERYLMRKDRNLRNRRFLLQQIQKLEEVATGSLLTLREFIINGVENFLGLNYIRGNILIIHPDYKGMGFVDYQLARSHCEALRSLNLAIDNYTSRISKPILNEQTYKNIESITNLLRATNIYNIVNISYEPQISKSDLQEAKKIVEGIQSIGEIDKSYFQQLARNGKIIYENNKKYFVFINADGEEVKIEVDKNFDVNNKQYLEEIYKDISSIKKISENLNRYLELALRYFDKQNQDQEYKLTVKYYIKLSQVYAWVLNVITEVNREIDKWPSDLRDLKL